IRGHRVKSCSHSNRNLVLILNRGRQKTQCDHCRELRKTSQCHVKCSCAVRSK
ncbi:hypothetical protein BDB01DRAFT_716672, partial [Pilobolus umbonatus]